MRTLMMITFSLVLLSGCKLAVVVAEGGKVVAGSSGECLAGSVCRYAVPDTSYTETFTAVAYPGWEFVGWRKGEKSLCWNEASNLCSLDASALEGTDAESVIASNDTFYLEPEFTCISADCGAVGNPLRPVVCDFSDFNFYAVALNTFYTPVDFSGRTLRGCNLRGAGLFRANLKNADLIAADLTGASLREADLTEADVRFANLTSANLTGANLTGADLAEVNLTDADLTGAYFDFPLGFSKTKGILWDNTTCPDGSKTTPPTDPGLVGGDRPCDGF